MSDLEHAPDTPPLLLKTSGLTDVGLRRPHNEDSIILAPEVGLFVVADGMGGHAAGEVASRTAVQALRDFIDLSYGEEEFTWPFGFDEKRTRNENLLHSAVLLANRKVCTIAQDNPECLGMGTTLAVLQVHPQEVVIAHVGDSRVYRKRNGELQLLTMDHSWVNEQLQRNVLTEEEARNHRWRNVITRALGNRPDIDIDLQTLATQKGDLFLLCSDGLTTMLEDSQIAKVLEKTDQDIDLASRTLIDAANQMGGFDNISAILVRIEG